MRTTAFSYREDRQFDRMVNSAVEGVESATEEQPAIPIMNLVHAGLQPRLDSLEQTGSVGPIS